jgi:hypothetical protein
LVRIWIAFGFSGFGVGFRIWIQFWIQLLSPSLVFHFGVAVGSGFVCTSSFSPFLFPQNVLSVKLHPRSQSIPSTATAPSEGSAVTQGSDMEVENEGKQPTSDEKPMENATTNEKSEEKLEATPVGTIVEFINTVFLHDESDVRPFLQTISMFLFLFLFFLFSHSFLFLLFLAISHRQAAATSSDNRTTTRLQ